MRWVGWLGVTGGLALGALGSCGGSSSGGGAPTSNSGGSDGDSVGGSGGSGAAVGGSGGSGGSTGGGGSSANVVGTSGITIGTSGAAGACDDSECDPGSGPCGDGVLEPDEACDDGNRDDGDGCGSDCEPEPGASCAHTCQFFAICGDGIVTPPENCDDANEDAGDGCSELCRVEPGQRCEGEPSVCTSTVCGDGVQERAESCDDGNQLAFDGCSPTCQVEPCRGCTTCGDGIVQGEECDDGNLQAGDGCSPDCTREDGFTCSADEGLSNDRVNDIAVLRLPVVYRDFATSHPDFEGVNDDCSGVVPGLVETSLNDQGKPVWAASSPCTTSAENFAEWYTDVEGKNSTIAGELVLFDAGDGRFVNRYGADGEQWAGPDNETTVYCNSIRSTENYPSTCAWCTLSSHESCFDPCTPDNNAVDACKVIPGQLQFDGTPLYFPVDGVGIADTTYRARIPEEYGYARYPYESEITGEEKKHNFEFTTQLHAWFRYDAGLSPKIAVSSDDDLWVFVNGRLVIDLGGMHLPVEAEYTLDASAAATLGLTDGGVFELAVFHAERGRDTSALRLSLQNFRRQRSLCTGVCGDGQIQLGEQCDDGVNDGGYGECAPGCVANRYCGDGVVDEGFEDCDDGNRHDGDACPSVCRFLD